MIYENISSSSEPASTIEIAELLGDQGHQHPHDAIWLSNGDVVVCCWSGPADPGLGPAFWERGGIGKEFNVCVCDKYIIISMQKYHIK